MHPTAPTPALATAPAAITVEQILDFVRSSLKQALDQVRRFEQRCREGALDGAKAAVLIDGFADLGSGVSVVGTLLRAAGAFQEAKSVDQGVAHLNEIARQAAYECRMSCIGRASWQQAVAA